MPRKRSEINKAPESIATQFKPVGEDCSICGSPQFHSPGGAVCENRHGGAPGIDPGTFKPKLPPIPDSPFGGAVGRQASFPKAPDMDRGFHTVVRDIYAEGFDVAAEFKAVQASLVMHGVLDREALIAAANKAEDAARRAHRLQILAKAEYEHYVRRTDAIVGSIRDAAEGTLEKEKAAKIRTKQITDGDVDGRCASMYPDAWLDVNAKRDRAKGMVAHVEKLAELATIRCRTLSSMIAARGAKM